MVTKFSQMRKAVAAFLVGLAGFLIVALPLITDGNITNADIVAVVGSLGTWLGGTGAVYQVTNAPLTK